MRLTLAIAFVIEIVIAFVIEIVIAFVIQTFDQVNITIASTSQVDPLRLCMYMHRSTLVYICPNISVWCLGSKLSHRPCFQHLDSYFCAPVRWFDHFSCVIFCTFVTFLVHFCPQVQQFGHFCNFPAVTFFCAFACCTSIFVDRRDGLATFSILHQFFTILEFSTLGPLKLPRLSAKVDGRQNCQKP